VIVGLGRGMHSTEDLLVTTCSTIYTVTQKHKHATLHLFITLTTVDRFSKFFNCQNHREICNKTTVIFPTTR